MLLSVLLAGLARVVMINLWTKFWSSRTSVSHSLTLMEFDFQNGVIHRTRFHKIRGICIHTCNTNPSLVISSKDHESMFLDAELPYGWHMSGCVRNMTPMGSFGQWRTPGPHGVGKCLNWPFIADRVTLPPDGKSMHSKEYNALWV
ncbi:hypothetical protein SCLCIDRAFT_306087 [Scleroderma citrinum Foug A]|uniref:Uncharacterized protein n=1 Tax=Scleroderma citrinum Foug A TaxID=1036808 RepID=A0A0C2ZS20_9AGAM|nr:hypothetical protein SCLCIDRAFT_306087 [Scleroderma citrinum Foug A]